jgi:hypothetical protein
MSDDKKKPVDISLDMMLADAMLRITALEKILVNKGIINSQELQGMNTELAKKVAQVVMEKLEASKNLDDFIGSLAENNNKDLKN